VTLVIDASAALYLLASERGIEPFASFELASPALLWSEVTSVLNETRWRGELSRAPAQTAFDRLLASPIDRRGDDGSYRDARELARTLGWARTYEAEYAAVARALEVDLMSPETSACAAASPGWSPWSHPTSSFHQSVRQGWNNRTLPVGRCCI
jgi:predicted nucleic acid-binding protein